jgi:hypothetical protein
LQSLGINDAELQLLDDPFDRWSGHGFKSGVSTLDRVEMPPELALSKADETTAVGLRLMKCFLSLRSRQSRQELLALAERLAREEETAPTGPAE